MAQSFSTPSPKPAGCDPRLEPFLRAQTQAEREKHLIDLIETTAKPVMEQVLRRKFRSEHANDFEDVLSDARAELVRRLQALGNDASATPIANFRAYASSVAYTAWAEHLRRAYPARSMLLNRLRYLLENRTNQHGFAIWEGANGERWCGFQRWRAAGASAASETKLQRLLLGSTDAAEEALGRSDFSSINFAALVAGLFEWLGGPIELRHLVEALGELLGISDRQESLGAEAIQDVAPSPMDAMTWHEYLHWLWQNITALSLPQRTAFLLHSEVGFDFEVNGVASIRDMAALLEVSAEQMSEWWSRIPLEDFVIADLLGKERQQVINLRRVARDHLGAAWEKWAQ